MHKSTLFSFFTLLLLFSISNLHAQNSDSYNTYPDVIEKFRLPIDRNGLSETAFILRPRINIERWENTATIWLDIKKVQSSVYDPNPSYLCSYNYMGKQYGNQHVGKEPFASIKADGISYSVLVHYKENSFGGWRVVDGMTNKFGPIEKNAKASDVVVWVKINNIQSFNGTNEIEKKIQAIIDADKKSNESPPFDNLNNPENGKSESRNTKSEETNNTSGIGTNDKSDGANNAVDKTPNKSNNESSTTSNTNRKDSNSNPNIVNGIDRSKLPKYVKESTTGKYYEKDADNNYHEIAYEDYIQGKRNESKVNQDQIQAEKQRQDDELVRKTKDELQASSNKYWADVAEMQRKSEISYQNNLASFYAAKEAEEAKGQIRDNSKLSGNYNNAEELRADYRQKYQALSQGYQSLQEANIQKNQANLNIYNQNTDENGKILGQFATDVSNYIGQMQAEADEKRAKQALRAQRDAAEAELIRIEKANRLELRKKFISQFPDGGLPLSSYPVDLIELYFFTYVFNSNTINDDYPKITVSNVFPIARYKDGTWLFKNRLITEISKSVTTTPITLMGYYTTKEMAEDMRKAFIELAKSTNMSITDFEYKGKPATSESSTGVDYWGNDTEKSNFKPNVAVPSEGISSPNSGKIDFWGNPVNSDTQKKPAATKAGAQPKSNNTKVDFWGNPIK